MINKGNDRELPPMVSTYLQSHAPPGELIGFWQDRHQDFFVLILYRKGEAPWFSLGNFPEVVGNWGHQLNGADYDLAGIERQLGSGLWGAEETVCRKLSERIASIRQSTTIQHFRGVARNTMRTTLFALDPDRFERNFLYLTHPLPNTDWQRIIAAVNDSEEAEDALSDLEEGDVEINGDRVTISPRATRVLWEVCKAECAVTKAEIQSRDFFFQDLEANFESRVSLPDTMKPVWHHFLLCVDIAARNRPNLPWWLDRAGTACGSSVGLLTPSAVRLIARHSVEILTILGQVSEGAFTEDGANLLRAISHIASSDGWIVGWEPGT